jgi:large subunit ribosomal protein L23
MGILDTIKGKKGAKPAKKAVAAEKPKKAVTKKSAPKEAEQAEVAAASGRTGGSLAASRVLRKPVFTEKSERLQAAGQYTFIVDRDANKTEVARAVRDIYGVTPAHVRITVTKGKAVRFGRSFGFRQDVKKAVVTLKKGEKITVMQGA